MASKPIGDESDRVVTPNTFERVGRMMLNGEPTPVANDDSGFIKKGYRRLLVGYRDGPQSWILGSMSKRTSVINQNDVRLKTQENTSIKCVFHRYTSEIDVDTIDPDDFTKGELVEDDDAEYIDTGYVNGYRVSPIGSVVEDIFKWYSD